jgi:hypothetical protein
LKFVLAATVFSYIVVFSRLLGPQCGVFVAILRLSSDCRRILGVHAPQVPAGEHQICQPEQCEQLRVVLGQTALAGLVMFEQACHDMDAMLKLGTHAGLRLSQFLDRAAQRIFLEDLALARAYSGMPVITLDRVLFASRRLDGTEKRALQVPLLLEPVPARFPMAS